MPGDDHGPLGCDIAVVGMAALFPGSGGLDAYWSSLVAGADAVGDVPADRWEPVFYDPDHPGPDRFAVRRGGFLGDLATFDPTPFGIMPAAVDGIEPDQLIALRLAAEAMADAGGPATLGDPDATGVILGRGGYLTPGLARLDQRVRLGTQVAGILRSVLPGIGGDQVEELTAALAAALGPDRPEGAIDLVPNLTASRVANRLDLRGPAYTVDGACASSLLAVDAGIRELASGRCDAVLAGGVHLCHDVTLWSVFTQLGALSSAGVMRPFDRRADGLVIGEGAGVVVLKRRADAERDGDRIYAVLAGLGVSSDGRATSLMRPSTDGQVLALERAWRQAGIDPARCGLVEAHGTATRAGDTAELETLARFFGPAGSPGIPAEARPGPGGAGVVGSVKSMIGHAMPAAGAAGLIKAVLAVHHGIAPPSLHCEEPDEALGRTRFAVVAEAVPWDAPPPLRVAAVDAFGFGGINAHAVVVAHPDGSSRPSPVPATALGPGVGLGPRLAPARTSSRAEPPGGRLVLVAGATVGEVLARLDAIDDGALAVRDDRSASPTGSVRLAMVDPTPRRRDLARRAVAGGKPWRGRNDVFFAPDGLVTGGGRIAFVFPGVEPTAEPDVSEVAEHFGWPVPQRLGETELEVRSRDILWCGRILDAAAGRLGLRPDVYAGHSLGEWSGLIATGMVPGEIVDELSNGLLPSRLEVPDVGYLFVGAGAATTGAALAGVEGAALSHDNCPHQSVVCGTDAALGEVAARLRSDGVLCQELPVRSGFHSPAFAPFLEPFRRTYDRIDFRPPSVPLWSATIAGPYPDDPAAVAELCLAHLVEPVRFRQLVEALYDAGVRVFVQLGFGSVTGFVDDTLQGRSALALTAGSARHPGMAQFVRMAAGLWAEGAPVDLAVLAAPGSTVATGASTVTSPGTSPGSTAAVPGKGRRLRLGVPLVHLEPGAVTLTPPVPARQPTGAPATADIAPPPGTIPAPLAPHGLAAAASSLGLAPGHPVLDAYDRVVAETLAAGRAVLDAYVAAATQSSRLPPEPPAGGPPVLPAPPAGGPPPLPDRPAPPPGSQRRQVHRVLSVETEPFLLDHCFYRQPAGWPVASDLFPVVPMTMLIALMGDEARSAVPGTVVVGLDGIRALRWLAVAPPVEITVRSEVVGPVDGTDLPVGSTAVRVSIDGYASATVLVAPSFPAPPPADGRTMSGSRPVGLSAREMYDDRWMFHGPAYQGVVELGSTADDGIEGVLEDLPAPGALLDCAGQLMGLWAMRATETDRLALPTSIRRLRFFGPFPGPGVPVGCRVWITAHDERIVRSDMELAVAGSVLVTVEDWEDRRFESDAAVWPILIYPETNVLSERWDVTDGLAVHIAGEHWTNSASRDLMMRRYLGEAERSVYDRRNPRAQRAHLLGRIAAKDGVRRWAWDRGGGPLHPVQVAVANDGAGRPSVTVGGADGPAVSIAHAEWIGAAAVCAVGPVGVDVERIEVRAPSFADLALVTSERPPEGLDPETWVTLAWTAKEAVGKARGTGLAGRPRDIVVAAARAVGDVDGGDAHRWVCEVDDPDGRRWTVHARRFGGHIVAVTRG